MKRILLLCSRSVTVIYFRKGLIKALKKADYEVFVCALDSDKKKEIEDLGVFFYDINSNNRSTNPIEKLKLLDKYQALIKTINPDVVFTFQATPNAFGVLAAKKAGIKNIYSMVEGAGDPFILSGLKWTLIRTAECLLFKMAFKYVKKVFFLNHDDQNEFLKRKILNKDKAVFIHGIGVDTKRFNFEEVVDYTRFVMIARLMPTKGIKEYLEASRMIKREYPFANMDLIGEEFTLKISDIQEYLDDHSINYLGYQKDVRPFIKNAAIYVLPSYREGCPMTVMEAESMGRGVIVSDVPGCRETVINDYNGLLCKAKDANDLYLKMKYILDNPLKVSEYSKNAREYTMKNFDEDVINEFLLNCINL